MKGRETLSRSHNGLNETDDNMRLTENFFASTELCNVHDNFKVLLLKFLLFIVDTYFLGNED
jgi:hypothetical protein